MIKVDIQTMFAMVESGKISQEDFARWIEQGRDQARQEGYTEGHEQGWNEGRDHGYDSGYDQGRADYGD